MVSTTQRIVVLGSTGSIGRNVLNVVAHHRDRFEIVGLAAGSNASLLAEQCAEHRQAKFSMSDETAHRQLTSRDPSLLSRSVGSGNESLLKLVGETEPDLVVNCLVGFMGLKPTLFALESGIPVALANKEAVVTGGKILKRASEKTGAGIIPIDSEHVAISQCLRGSSLQDVKMVYLTASGGALRDRPLAELADASIDDVLAHPTWEMGNKITVDSATLLNKGLEVIEAHWFFDLPFEKIKVVIHPQSIVHSLVEFRDNSIIAQMGLPDMRLPILYALSYPERLSTTLARSEIARYPDLSFRDVDGSRYPCLELAYQAGERGGNAPTVLNSANEAAVGAFLAGNIPFSSIHRMIGMAMDHIPHRDVATLEDIVEADRETTMFVEEKLGVRRQS